MAKRGIKAKSVTDAIRQSGRKITSRFPIQEVPYRP